MILRITIVFLLLLLIEFYFYRAILTLIRHKSNTYQKRARAIYFSFTLFLFLFFISLLFFPFKEWPKFFKIYLSSFIFVICISKLTGCVVLLFDDLIRFIQLIAKTVKKIWLPQASKTDTKDEVISRKKFLSIGAVIFSSITFLPLIYGMLKGAFSYRVISNKLSFNNLPEAFRGMKILQISDIHTGSFVDDTNLRNAVAMINAQKADIVFFTGDLVNDKTEEVLPFMDVLSQITAPMGVYSILGNHDYGDYPRWDKPEDKKANFEAMLQTHQKLGWKLLRNEHIVLEKNNEKIALLGVENWGGKMGFPKYGKIEMAHEGTQTYPFKILLSHDPTHWDLKIKELYPDIDLTLSGHTHGMQFGVEIPGFRWSPSQYVFKQWAGLYQHQNQYLYVNRGLGFLGYAGRVGILPEITVIELT